MEPALPFLLCVVWEIELRLPAFCGKHFDPLSHLTGPWIPFPISTAVPKDTRRRRHSSNQVASRLWILTSFREHGLQKLSYRKTR